MRGTGRRDGTIGIGSDVLKPYETPSRSLPVLNPLHPLHPYSFTGAPIRRDASWATPKPRLVMASSFMLPLGGGLGHNYWLVIMACRIATG